MGFRVTPRKRIIWKSWFTEHSACKHLRGMSSCSLEVLRSRNSCLFDTRCDIFTIAGHCPFPQALRGSCKQSHGHVLFRMRSLQKMAWRRKQPPRSCSGKTLSTQGGSRLETKGSSILEFAQKRTAKMWRAGARGSHNPDWENPLSWSCLVYAQKRWCDW